jgi:hypothetical protein
VPKSTAFGVRTTWVQNPTFSTQKQVIEPLSTTVFLFLKSYMTTCHLDVKRIKYFSTRQCVEFKRLKESLTHCKIIVGGVYFINCSFF